MWGPCGCCDPLLLCAGKSAAECYQRIFEPMAPRTTARTREAALPQAAPPPERTAAGNAATAAQKRRWQRDMRWALQATKADSNARALELEVRMALLLSFRAEVL